MTKGTQARSKSGKFAKAVKPRKVAIWGYAEESRNLVYDLSEDFEIWGINMAHAFMNNSLKARPTNWFQLHPSSWSGAGSNVTGYYGRPKAHIDFLEQFDGTVWMQYPDEPVAANIKNRKKYQRQLKAEGSEHKKADS